MSAPWPHAHVSEREAAHTWPDGRADDSHWEDCLWCSVVEFLNDTYRDVSDSLTYAEKLRAASGEPPSGGSNFGNVRDAFAKLGIAVTVTPVTYGAFRVALAPGYAGVATGSYANFPAGHRLRRWDPGFAGGHAVYVARLADGTLWWCDPLAPKGTYNGQAITEAELKQFMGSSWTGIVRKVRAKTTTTTTGGDMPTLTTYTPGATANVKPESNIRSAATITAATKLRSTAAGVKEPVVLTGTVSGAVDPANGSTVWYVWWKNGRWEYTAKDNIVDLKAAGTGDCTAAVDAAVKAQITKDAAAQATAVEKAKADATTAERERLAKAEADRVRKL